MLNLLDTVPDKVLICPLETDDIELCPLYSNLSLCQFYGEDLAEGKNAKNKKLKKRKQRDSTKQYSRLFRTI